MQAQSVLQLHRATLEENLGNGQGHQSWVLGKCSRSAVKAEKHSVTLQILKDDFGRAVALVALSLVCDQLGTDPRHNRKIGLREEICRDLSHRTACPGRGPF